MQNFPWLLSRVLLSSMLIATSGAANNHQSSSPQKTVLSRPIAMGDISRPTPLVFQGAAIAAGVPGGAAFVEGCTNQPLRKVRPEGSTLGEVLRSIIHSDPRYVWTVNAGVANLEPSRGIPALLTTRLESYNSGAATDAASAITFLSSSGEVVRAAKELGLAHNVSGSALGGISEEAQPPKKPLNIHVQDVTLLQALNAIVRANKHGVWMYRETHCGSIRQYNITLVE